VRRLAFLAASAGAGKSSNSRVLPIPGSPANSTIPACPARASPSELAILANSRPRPTNGARPTRKNAGFDIGNRSARERMTTACQPIPYRTQET